jgi:hypothetical protein
MTAMKCPRSATWFACLCLLALSATGCGVSNSGLGGRPDAAGDAPGKIPDTRPAAGLDANSVLPETNPDAIPVAAPDGAPANTPDATSDRALSPDVAAPSPDLFLADSAPLADAPVPFEVASTPDVLVPGDASDVSYASDLNDLNNLNDGPIAPQPDSPIIVQVDGPGPDTLTFDLALPDLPPPDLALADRTPDLFTVVDVPGPDQSPPDLGPQPTSNWVIDNTTNIGGFTTTVMGAPTVTAMDAGTAVCFDGALDGLVLGTNPIQGMQRFTIEALAFPAFTGTADTRLIQITDTNNLRLVIGMRSDPAGNWHALVTFTGGGPGTTIEDTNNLHPSDQWYWLTVTYDGQTARVYVNGVLENSRNLTFGPMTAGSLSLASRPNGQFNFLGCMRDVKFFASALPAAQLDKP